MFCTVCNEEIPDDSLFCPECGARQDPSKSGAMGGRNFGVVSGQAVQATRDMQSADAAAASAQPPVDPEALLSKIADQMGGNPAQSIQPNISSPTTQPEQAQNYSQTDQIVDRIVDNERQEKVLTNCVTISGEIAPATAV